MVLEDGTRLKEKFIGQDLKGQKDRLDFENMYNM